MKKPWKNEEAYIRILEILSTYWLEEPEELKVRVQLDFVKANGEQQSKCIRWINPNYKYIGEKCPAFVSLADMDDEYFKRQEERFWDCKNYVKKEDTI